LLLVHLLLLLVHAEIHMLQWKLLVLVLQWKLLLRLLLVQGLRLLVRLLHLLLLLLRLL
jgi:hypothetical protein